ncbi:MAG: hypothetical protein K5872_02645 [Rhizobiaceae bacterium]|nr:hypothetical protein [Rhizobiaceae bacterium]MCV0405109.1 hypothetical protein [Rhizobiaceae bacterium]
MKPPLLALPFAAAALLLLPKEALAHAADRGFVMILPTGYYLVGGAVSVALSFILLAIVPVPALERPLGWRAALSSDEARGGRNRPIWPSLLSFLLLAGLVLAGLAGSRDPLSNPLPLTIWTLWWVGLTLVQGLVGNVWRWIEPWSGMHALICRLAGRDPEAPGPLRLPPSIAFWSAIALFGGFAWFELVHASPDDPGILAIVVAAYWLFTLVMTILFGRRHWLRRGEPFSIFFSMISRLAPLDLDGRRPAASLPGARLANAPCLPIGGVLFLLLALSTVSFDGLMRTFFWFGLNGLNPLEFEGRSSVTAINTIGIAAMFAALTGAFLAAVAIGERLASSRLSFTDVAGRLVWSIIPISLAYHFSHYLVSLIVNGQYALAALSDPLSRGWNLFGTAGLHVRAGLASGHDASWAIWNAQAAAIIGGHIIAVAVAHLVAYRLHGDARKAAISQLPLAVLMVAYTVFGLWLLSQPTGA